MSRWLPLPVAVAVALLFLAIVPPAAASDPDCAQTGAVPYQPTYAEFEAAFRSAARSDLGPGYPRLDPIELGPGDDPPKVESPVPDVLLMAIGFIESSWRMARWAERGTAGEPLVTAYPSCGYGTMQIAGPSGMREPGQLDPAVQYAIADDYRFNIAWGANLLIGKWNVAPYESPSSNVNFRYVGDRNPCLIEDWYYAVWAYNNAGYVNNPANPDYPADRPVFDPNNPAPGIHYPYQEYVWGLMRNPQRIAGSPLWPAVAVSFPPRELFSADPDVRWDNIPTPEPSHQASSCSFQLAPMSNQTLVVARNGTASLPLAIEAEDGATASWTSTVSSGTDPQFGDWVIVEPGSGTALPASASVRATPSLAGKGNGSYTGQVTVEAAGGTTVIPLTVIVVDTVYRAHVPAAMEGSSLP